MIEQAAGWAQPWNCSSNALHTTSPLYLVFWTCFPTRLMTWHPRWCPLTSCMHCIATISRLILVFRIVGAGCRMMVLTGVTSLSCIYQKMVTNVKHKARFRGTNDDVLTWCPNLTRPLRCCVVRLGSAVVTNEIKLVSTPNANYASTPMHMQSRELWHGKIFNERWLNCPHD